MGHSVNVELGKSVRDRRFALRLSVEAAAASVGISEDRWKDYESAKEEIPVGQLLMIANALDIHPYGLFEKKTVKPGSFSKEAFEIFYLWRQIEDPEKRRQLLESARQMTK